EAGTEPPGLVTVSRPTAALPPAGEGEGSARAGDGGEAAAGTPPIIGTIGQFAGAWAAATIRRSLNRSRGGTWSNRHFLPTCESSWRSTGPTVNSAPSPARRRQTATGLKWPARVVSCSWN